jgi:hypothetical protein
MLHGVNIQLSSEFCVELAPNLNKNDKDVTWIFVDGRISQGMSVPVFDLSVGTKLYIL